MSQSEPIYPARVKGYLMDLFPGVHVVEESSLGRRRVYRLQFSEFTLSVTTPETEGMAKSTTFAFRREVGGKRVLAKTKTFEHTDWLGLRGHIDRARSYVMGLIEAMSDAFSDHLGSPLADIFGEDYEE